GYGILPGNAVKDLLRRDAKGCKLGVAELNVDPLRLLADDISLVHVRHAQQALTDVFGPRLELGVGLARAGEHIERRVNVAELVVEIRSLNIRRQVVADVSYLFPDLVPELLYLRRRSRIAEDDADERNAWP